MPTYTATDYEPVPPGLYTAKLEVIEEAESLHGVLKNSSRLPNWLEDALQQAEISAKDGRLPAAVLPQDRKPYLQSLAILGLEDFAHPLVQQPIAQKGRYVR